MTGVREKIIFCVVGIVLLAGLIWGPRRLWLHHMASRFEAVENHLRSCGVPCLAEATTELEALEKEMSSPPWYVWGAPKPYRTPQSAASSSSAPVEPATARWERSETKSEMDSAITVVLRHNAESSIHGPVEDKTPTLILRCRGNKKLEAYIHTGMSASVEYGTSTHAVRLKFDDKPPVKQHWGESDTNDALFYDGDSTSLFDRLKATKALKFEFTPFDAVTQVATFNVEHLDTVAGPDFCSDAFQASAKSAADDKTLRAKLASHIFPCKDQELGKWCWSDPDNALFDMENGFAPTKEAALADAVRSAKTFKLFKKN